MLKYNFLGSRMATLDAETDLKPMILLFFSSDAKFGNPRPSDQSETLVHCCSRILAYPLICSYLANTIHAIKTYILSYPENRFPF